VAFQITGKKNTSDAYQKFESFSDEFSAIDFIEKNLVGFVPAKKGGINPSWIVEKYVNGEKSVLIINETEKEIEAGKHKTWKHKGKEGIN
jgi:hypothetical protein